METLDLRSTGISKLPKSISLLLSLRSLYLDYCVFDPSTDISLFCLLKKLVILSLQGCSLQVPPNVISRLSQLEELYMTESFSGWEIEGCKVGNESHLEELTYLLKRGELTTLHFSLDKSHSELFTRTGLDYASCHNFLDLMVSPPICQILWLTIWKSMAQIVPAHVGFEKMKSLGIEECNGMESLMRAEEYFRPNLLKRVPNLEALRIEGCDMLREIFNLEKAAEPIPGETSDNVSTFLKLTKIHLEKLQSLDIICKGVIPNGGFDNLLKVELYSCDRIEHLFSLDIAAGLRQLKELKIQFCLKMVQLIAPGEDSSTFVSPEWKFFPKLETLLFLLPELITLELKDLPEITDLHRGSTSLNLKRICLSYQRTPKLEKIVGIDELWFESFEWEKPIDKQYMRHLFSEKEERNEET
ncbi:hypothetical protein MKW92_032432 [Papaver armeniacum]|nr:hypothetical protein MKW92_032432 [Papaver armeniacum]